MSDMTTSLHSVLGFLSMVIHGITAIGLLIFTFTTIAPRRPRSHSWVVALAGFGLFVAAIQPILSVGLNVVSTRFGVESMMVANSVFIAINIVLHIVEFAFLLLTLNTLSKPEPS